MIRARDILLALVIWPFLLPLGLIRIYRIVRRVVRKATKRPRLWLNAWQYKQSEDEVNFFASQRQILIEAEQQERRRQVRLQMQRNRIAGW